MAPLAHDKSIARSVHNLIDPDATVPEKDPISLACGITDLANTINTDVITGANGVNGIRIGSIAYRDFVRRCI